MEPATYTDDDILPNDGYFVPREPREAELERKKEKSQTLQELPVIITVIERLKAQAAYYDSVDSVKEDIELEPKKFAIQHLANKQTRKNLETELEWLEELMKQHAAGKL